MVGGYLEKGRVRANVVDLAVDLGSSHCDGISGWGVRWRERRERRDDYAWLYGRGGVLSRSRDGKRREREKKKRQERQAGGRYKD